MSGRVRKMGASCLIDPFGSGYAGVWQTIAFRGLPPSRALADHDGPPHGYPSLITGCPARRSVRN
jgi:hypothetical protein